MIRMSNYALFWSAYQDCLEKGIRANPQDYGVESLLYVSAPELAHEFAARMKGAGIDRCNISSPSFRGACRAVGIKHSRKAIKEFIDSPDLRGCLE